MESRRKPGRSNGGLGSRVPIPTPTLTSPLPHADVTGRPHQLGLSEFAQPVRELMLPG